MTCPDYQVVISRLLDHQIGLDEMKDAFIHLGTCNDCRIYYLSASRIELHLRKSAAEAQESPSSPPNFREFVRPWRNLSEYPGPATVSMWALLAVFVAILFSTGVS